MDDSKTEWKMIPEVHWLPGMTIECLKDCWNREASIALPALKEANVEISLFKTVLQKDVSVPSQFLVLGKFSVEKIDLHEGHRSWLNTIGMQFWQISHFLSPRKSITFLPKLSLGKKANTFRFIASWKMDPTRRTRSPGRSPCGEKWATKYPPFANPSSTWANCLGELNLSPKVISWGGSAPLHACTLLSKSCLVLQNNNVYTEASFTKKHRQPRKKVFIVSFAQQLIKATACEEMNDTNVQNCRPVAFSFSAPRTVLPVTISRLLQCCKMKSLFLQDILNKTVENRQTDGRTDKERALTPLESDRIKEKLVFFFSRMNSKTTFTKTYLGMWPCWFFCRQHCLRYFRSFEIFLCVAMIAWWILLSPTIWPAFWLLQ